MCILYVNKIRSSVIIENFNYDKKTVKNDLVGNVSGMILYKYTSNLSTFIKLSNNVIGVGI